MPKVITISDEVYEKLVKLKGDRSFSETINELIQFYNANKKGRKEILDKMFGILTEKEVEDLEKEISQFRNNFRTRSLENGNT
ncbi:antitoxin [Sulfolobus sp. A20]|uniref:antitoxin VapB family protein n=1 Tax=Saccharolobus sp. A20 TaxID=1891280 RepID=UPI0008461FE3|nr:antitoxin VapB family protein [Sulfolobus sp. A20]TRM75084.1 antitoxin [Sulfolobus sp. B5]TRM76199.1 antitoxin [Sulfolobus sp. A20-N-F8]TRM84696.1 antitoxin [Sulfolobus sp. F3]TRM87718.1 antitoxin [Sulfolobus sp. C3]TRN01873.1 antitoxin [Sulfolobus sp. E1]